MMNGYPYGYNYSFPPGDMRGYGGMQVFPYSGGNQSIKPFIEIFNVSPNLIKTGQTVLLHWNVVGANTVTITGIGNVPSNGSSTLTPGATTTYILTAVNTYTSDSRSVTVNVVP